MMLASRNADGGIDLRSPHFRYGLRGFFGTGLGKVVEGEIIPDRYHLPDLMEESRRLREARSYSNKSVRRILR